MSEARLKPGGVILIVGFAATLVGMAWYATQKKAEQQGGQQVAQGGQQGGGQQQGGGGQPPAQPQGDGDAVPLTSNEFEEVGRQTVPQLKGSGKFAWNDKDPTVVFPINIWAGWGPIIAANDGFAPGSPNSLFKKYGFKVELRLIDDPAQAADAYASGQAHTMWGTLDMIALFAPQMKKVGLTPRVFQQIDWSRGGDGIVVRSTVKSVADLKGKTVALCQNSPSHFYILRLLDHASLSHQDVKFRFTSTAFGASALFAQDRSVHACVSWAPDIYTLVDPKHNVGNRNRLLSTTADAANIIADVWAARPDFAQEHPKVIEGLVRGIFEGMKVLQDNPDRVAQLMAQGYGFPVDDCKAMLGDAYSTGLGDNERFFLDQDSSINFVATWNEASRLYRQYGAIEGQPVPADQVMDASVIRKLKEEGAFADQQAEHKTFEPVTAEQLKGQIEATLPEILRVPLHVQYKPNAWDLDTSYDATIPETLKKIKQLSEEFGAARIVIEGNVDTSRKNEFRSMGPRIYAEMTQAVQELSEKRANALREAVLKQMPGTDPNKIIAFGNGWDHPIDPVDHAKNRRVDVRVLPVE
ncbi:MAG: ABC transporter substrate-binding protein [Planctomycetota bacterium]|nr:ABC transporter substrate-binding protein [Planctomycetota bacterium]